MRKLLLLIMTCALAGGIMSCRSEAQKKTSPPAGEERPRQEGRGREEKRGDEGELILMKLENFLRFEKEIPAMALTAEQKEGILPILKEWKDILDSGKRADGQYFTDRIAALLTEDQNSYDPFSSGGSQGSGPQPGGAPPQGNGGPPQEGTPPQGGPGGGPGNGPAPGGNPLVDMLARLVDQLSLS